MKINAILQLACKKFARKVLAKRAREKHMLESEKSSARLHFANSSQDRPSHEVPAKHFACRILSLTFLLFTHTIYTFITHKSKRGYSEKTLESFLQHNTLIF